MALKDQNSAANQSVGQLRPPTFTVRALCLVVLLISIVMAVFHYWGPMAAFVMTLLLLAVFAHLAAAYVGDRLKKRPQGMKSSDRYPEFDPLLNRELTDDHFAPATTLSDTSPITWWLRYLIAAFILLGAGLGAYGSSWVDPKDFNYAVLAVCCGSGAALSGIFAFTLSGFLEQMIRSWFQASSSEKRKR